MKLRFTKMHGAGNDFVMLDGIGQRLRLEAAQLRWLADRHLGVGADQILVVEAAPDASVDFRYRIFNANGGEVEQCGNGARCFVKFVHQLGLTQARTIRVLTLGGVIAPRLEEDGTVSVDMGAADFAPRASGFDAAGLRPRREGGADFWPLAAGGRSYETCVVSMGNPHAVAFVADVERAPVATDGLLREHDARFAQGVNAGFAQVLDRSNLRLRVWERGTGETLACGTGACAAAAAALRAGWMDTPVRVHTRGGVLRIDWDGTAGASVRMTGPAVKVFDGEIELP